MRTPIICLLLAPLYSFSQTCIVIVKTETRIVVAADSKRITFIPLSNGKDSLRSDSICKVRHTGDIFFSNSGFDSENAYKTAQLCAESAGGIEKAALLYKSLRKTAIEQYLRALKMKGTLQQRFEYLWFYSTVFYGIEWEIPIVVRVDFALVSRPDEEIKLTENINVFKSRETNIVAIGHTNIVDSLIKKGVLEKRGVVDAAYFCVALQAERTPLTVALPITMAVLAPDKLEWKFNPFKCD
ncbi:MAG: hypothetical protein ACJ749_14880 [Flavisolibacter sp.]